MSLDFFFYHLGFSLELNFKYIYVGFCTSFCRFLKARKFDFEKTMQMWEEMLKWREEYSTDSIVKVI